MKPLNPIQLKQAGPVFARAIENLARLEKRISAEVDRMRQHPGNSFVVGQLENDLDQLRAENRALAEMFDLHSTAVILMEHAISEATGDTFTVTIAGDGIGSLQCVYEKGE